MGCEFDCGVGPGEHGAPVRLLLMGAFLLLGVLIGLMIGWWYALDQSRARRATAVEDIRAAIAAEIAVALAAYGADTMPAAKRLAAMVRQALTPVLDIGAGLSGPLKTIDGAEKGKIKDEARPGALTPAQAARAAHGGVVFQQTVVVPGSGSGPALACGCVGECRCAAATPAPPPPAPPSNERDMSPAEQAAEARKGIEAIAAFWRRSDLKNLLGAAHDCLENARVRPKSLFGSYGAAPKTASPARKGV